MFKGTTLQSVVQHRGHANQECNQSKRNATSVKNIQYFISSVRYVSGTRWFEPGFVFCRSTVEPKPSRSLGISL